MSALREIAMKAAVDNEKMDSAMDVLDLDLENFAIHALTHLLTEREIEISVEMLPVLVDVMKYGIFAGIGIGVAAVEEEKSVRETAAE